MKGEKSDEYRCTVNLQLSSEADGYPLPDILMETFEGDAGLSNPVVDFGIDVNHS